MKQIELLAPAKDLACGLAAVNCGADAVYIGAPRFGARENAGNSLDDIAALTSHAHKYWAKVYITLNTLLQDDEIPAALHFIGQLYDIGVDGLIIQDMGLLECNLPPTPLIASTQMHNHTPERIAFLQNIGFRRAILARELTLDQIRAIRRAAPNIELECFVHGALCVSYSGQCYLSYAAGGRSANRGQCAQPCRKPYSLVDSRGKVLQKDKYLLSIHDLNLSNQLGKLIGAGVCSFKIEGRLKDSFYVANNVAYYRKKLDEILPSLRMGKSSSGCSEIDFEPDPQKTFHRSYTTYFLNGRSELIGANETPKMMGVPIGRIVSLGKKHFTLDAKVSLHPGDGICFFDSQNVLQGTLVNAVQGRTITPDKMEGIAQGLMIYRNHDHEFLNQIKKSRMERRISVVLTLRDAPEGLALEAVDEDGVRVEAFYSGAMEAAQKPEKVLETFRIQLEKTGDTEFSCAEVVLDLKQAVFLPISAINELRRRVLEKLQEARAAARAVAEGGAIRNNTPYPEKEIHFQGNVLNHLAEDFYRRHGAAVLERAAESGLDLHGRKVMTTRYCLKHQLGVCPSVGALAKYDEPLFLIDPDGRRLELQFDCEQCAMEVIFREETPAPTKPKKPEK